MRSARALAVLIVLASTAHGQNPQQQGSTVTGKLSLSTGSAAARAEFWQGLEDWQTSAYTSGQRHFRRAVALDERFALARLFATGELATSRQQLIEREYALADAARQSTEEGILALAWREKALGHQVRARALWRAAMDIMPNEPAIAVEYLWASLAVNPKQGLDSARAFRTRFPSYAPLAYPVSVLSLVTGDTAGALRAAEDFTRIAPKTPASFGNYGALLQTLGRYDEAEAQYRKGIALAPVHADYGTDAASLLAELYAVRGRNADARTVASQALARALDPSDSAMYMTEIAGTYFVAGDNRQGMQLLESARQRSATMGSGTGPERLDAILAEANAVFGDGRSVSTYLARLDPVEPNDTAVVYVMHGTAYAYAGQLDSALAYSERLLNGTTVPWREVWSHRLTGFALATAKQCDRAKSELMKADSAGFEVLAARADCELQQGHKTAALALRDRALALQDFTYFRPAMIRARMRLAQMK